LIELLDDYRQLQDLGELRISKLFKTHIQIVNSSSNNS